MKPKLETDKGWTEAIIDDDCEFSKLYTVAVVLTDQLNVTFTNKFNDLDSIYWEFNYKNSALFLYYNIYMGVSIFPRAFASATSADNEAVEEISNLLFQKLIDLKWSDFKNRTTIGTTGAENGKIIYDIENSNGARITLEEECGNIPFAVTIGIYDLMFHTHYESESAKANEYMEQTKYSINKLFELYTIPEKNRNDYWQKRHDNIINNIAETTESTVQKTNTTDHNRLPIKKRSWWQKLFGIK